jgi:hypothetical protein
METMSAAISAILKSMSAPGAVFMHMAFQAA